MNLTMHKEERALAASVVIGLRQEILVLRRRAKPTPSLHRLLRPANENSLIYSNEGTSEYKY